MKNFQNYKIITSLTAKDFFYILFWLFLFLSINSKPSQLYSDGFGVINGMRSIIPTILLLPAIIFFFKSSFKRDKLYKSSNIIIYLFLLYSLSQVIGGILYDGFYNYYEANYLIYSYILLLLIIYELNQNNKSNAINLITIITVFFILVLSAQYIYSSLQDYFFNPNNAFTKWMYAVTVVNQEAYQNPSPRITGMSRIIALLSIIIMVFYFNIKKNSKKIILSIIFFSLITIIWMMQSRGTITCFIFSILFLIFFNYKLTLLKKIIITLICILIPFSMANIIYTLKISLKFYDICSKNYLDKNKNCELIFFDEKEINKFMEEFGKNKTKIKNLEKIIKSYKKNKLENRFIEPTLDQTSSYSSGRVEIWKRIYHLYNKNNIFGLGPQGDRKLLANEGDLVAHYSSNASSLVFYALISSGLIGLTCILLALPLIFIKILKILLIKNKLYEKKNIASLSSSIILIFLLIRALIENSFAIFSLDALFFFNALIILLTNSKNLLKSSDNLI